MALGTCASGWPYAPALVRHTGLKKSKETEQHVEAGAVGGEGLEGSWEDGCAYSILDKGLKERVLSFLKGEISCTVPRHRT